MKRPSTPISPFIEASHINYILSFNTLFNEIKTSLVTQFQALAVAYFRKQQTEKRVSQNLQAVGLGSKGSTRALRSELRGPLAAFQCHFLTPQRQSQPSCKGKSGFPLVGWRSGDYLGARVFWRTHLYYSFLDIWGGRRDGEGPAAQPQGSPGTSPHSEQ